MSPRAQPTTTVPRRQRFRSRRRLSLRDVVVFSLPLIALGLYLFGSAVLDYHRIRQFDDWWSRATSIRKFGWYRARAAVIAVRASGPAGEAVESVELGGVPDLFRFATLALRPGRYTNLSLEPRIDGLEGRFVLRSWRLLELPPAAG